MSVLDTAIDLSTPSNILRRNIHLKLYFYIFEIFVGRPFMFTNTKDVSRRSQSSSIDQLPMMQRANGRAFLVENAVQAAHKTIGLLHNLNQRTGLAQASYIEFSACRAALLMLLARYLNERSIQISMTIALGMRLIRLMASGNILSAKSEVSVIEALEEALRRLYARENRQDHNISVSFQADGEKEQSNYVQFEDWASLWDDLDAEMIQHFPEDNFAIYPQPSTISDFNTWSRGDNARWCSNEHSFANFPGLETSFPGFSGDGNM